MAEYKLGKNFSFKLNDILVVCKQTASLDLSNEGVIIRNDCTGDWGVRLSGGDKSGSFQFEADLDFAANGITALSWFELVPLLGTVQEVLFGDETAGEKYMLFDATLDNLSLSASRNEAITFSGTMNLSGDPQIITATS
jgi:hypothetical protein